jgi:hypothetical protein
LYLEGHTKYMIFSILFRSEYIFCIQKESEGTINGYRQRLYFYEGETSYLKVRAWDVHFIFPDDLHRPCIRQVTIQSQKSSC